MSKNQEQMKELINDVRTGKTDKEVLCKEIQKDVNCLIYPVFGEDYKKLSPRAIIDICIILIVLMLIRILCVRLQQEFQCLCLIL